MTSATPFASAATVGHDINVPIPVPMAWHGFGGWKRSLFGDMQPCGEEGVRAYTRQKSVRQRWPERIGHVERAPPGVADDAPRGRPRYVWPSILGTPTKATAPITLPRSDVEVP